LPRWSISPVRRPSGTAGRSRTVIDFVGANGSTSEGIVILVP
jgi:hypothetical protein